MRKAVAVGLTLGAANITAGLAAAASGAVREEMSNVAAGYVKRGEGTIDDRKLSWPLRPGFAIRAPPNVQHRLVNASRHHLAIATGFAHPPASGLGTNDLSASSKCTVMNVRARAGSRSPIAPAISLWVATIC